MLLIILKETNILLAIANIAADVSFIAIGKIPGSGTHPIALSIFFAWGESGVKLVGAY